MTRRVLIADDSAMSRKMIKRAMPVGWADEIFEAANGREALELLSKHRVDVMLLDLTMPELDGFEVLEQLSSVKSTTAKPKIFVISADYQHESVQRCIDSGAVEFVKKPITADTLKDVLGKNGCLS
ncbi:MAG: response regulator [Candidatus Thiodiazotropha sp. (ex Lucinoma kastoroae)]|nr:response regulator [Candidatus Thiodiazotropha sp. (ex Lucinoma kastoroae)]MCU7860733.1 response regulator [Candidatus Thiodiazotropha sp. (ex Lucinoma kastoroae)]